MPQVSPPQYTPDQLWPIFEKLPEELKQAVFSAENADHTFSICERHNIEECPKLASLVGLVLMGVMLPRDFEQALEKELGLDTTTAQRVAQEVNRFIFYPVKQQLEQLHVRPGEKKSAQETGITTPRHSDREARPTDEYMAEQEGPAEEKPVFTEEQARGKEDPYRESFDEEK